VKTRIAIVVAIVSALAVAAGAQELPDRIKKAGKLVVATKPNYPPITYKDPATNQNMGVDIDLGEAIAKELGVAIEWQDTEFAQIFSSLQTGRVDMALQGISDLPRSSARCRPAGWTWRCRGSATCPNAGRWPIS